jgi:hypothetical protein
MFVAVELKPLSVLATSAFGKSRKRSPTQLELEPQPPPWCPGVNVDASSPHDRVVSFASVKVVLVPVNSWKRVLLW